MICSRDMRTFRINERRFFLFRLVLMEAALFTKRDLIVGGCIFVAETIRINLQTPSQFIRRWGESGCRLSTSIIPSAHAAFEINVSFNNVQFGAFVQRQIYIFQSSFMTRKKSADIILIVVAEDVSRIRKTSPWQAGSANPG
jgi:hypothetical protein